MTTGEKITQCRKQLNMTQEELAGTLGVSRQAVSRWESDAAFPETDKLLKMSKLFSRSVDWLLKYGEEDCEDQTQRTAEEEKSRPFDIRNWHYEYKSKKTVFGLPLIHINIGLGRTAKGFFALGLKSVGVFSLGLLSIGIVSFGTLSLGIISLAAVGLGLISLGAVAAGILSLGGVAVGVFSFGGLAVGLLAYGGCAVGGFAVGGAAYGSFVAIGDRAVGGIALGGSYAKGSVYSALITDFKEKTEEIYAAFDGLPSALSALTELCRKTFDMIVDGRISLGGITL